MQPLAAATAATAGTAPMVEQTTRPARRIECRAERRWTLREWSWVLGAWSLSSPCVSWRPGWPLEKKGGHHSRGECAAQHPCHPPSALGRSKRDSNDGSPAEAARRLPRRRHSRRRCMFHLAVRGRHTCFRFAAHPWPPWPVLAGGARAQTPRRAWQGTAKPARVALRVSRRVQKTTETPPVGCAEAASQPCTPSNKNRWRILRKVPCTRC